MAFTVRLETSDGVFDVICDSAEDVREILGFSSVTGDKPKTRRSKRSKKRGVNDLANGLETDVWNFLCENDSENGVPLEEIESFIESLGRSRTSASPTLSALRRKHHAVQLLSTGNHRACTPD